MVEPELCNLAGLLRGFWFSQLGIGRRPCVGIRLIVIVRSSAVVDRDVMTIESSRTRTRTLSLEYVLLSP